MDANKTIKTRLIDYANDLLVHYYNRKLSPEQKIVLSGLWQGLSFEAIAHNTNYQSTYFKAIAANLWNLLSYCLEENINSKNFKSILIDRYPELKDIEPASADISSPSEVKDSPKPQKLDRYDKFKNREIESLICFTNEVYKSRFNKLLKSVEIKIITGICKRLSYDQISDFYNISHSSVQKNSYYLYKKLSDIFGLKVVKKNLYSTLKYYYQLSQKSHPPETNHNLPTAYISNRCDNLNPEPINSQYNRRLVLVIQVCAAEGYQFQHLNDTHVIEINPNFGDIDQIGTKTLKLATISAVSNLSHLRENEAINIPLQLKVVSNP